MKRLFVLVFVAFLFTPQLVQATEFNSQLTQGITFENTAVDSPAMVGNYGPQNYLDSNPDCPLKIGFHSYASQPFVTQNAGNHDMETTDATGGAGDTFIALYSPSFDPNNIRANLVTCDDDHGAGILSKITENLTAGAQYEVIVTTWNAVTIDGTVTWQILPDIVLGVLAENVPTLSEWGMIIFAAVLGILAVRRIRRQPGAAA